MRDERMVGRRRNPGQWNFSTRHEGSPTASQPGVRGVGDASAFPARRTVTYFTSTIFFASSNPRAG